MDKATSPYAITEVKMKLNSIRYNILIREKAGSTPTGKGRK
jgi:hypothetical protein